MSESASSGLGDEQGPRVGAPDATAKKRTADADAPAGRAEKSSGTGAEATQATGGEAEGHGTEHRGGYGGSGGTPVRPSDGRES